MRILVTGGAGYVGSVVAAELIRRGHDISIIDDLRQGHRRALPAGVPFFAADICSALELDKAFRNGKFEAVVHLAAEAAIASSMTDPAKFFHCNVTGGINLLDAMRKHGVANIIFSSSAAVYGEPRKTPIEENHPKAPVNSYGESKLMFERVLGWYGRAYGIRHVSLRYFNAAGADGRLGEDHRPETHLIPNILKSALDRDGCPVKVFGRDYPTGDGTCVRDYVHVSDIARAHILALKKLQSPVPNLQSPVPSPHYNLGSGSGYSVLQVIVAARKVTGVPIAIEDCPRRQGDPAVLVAGADKAREDLGWNPEYNDIEQIVETAWKWMKDHPEGYGE